MEKYYGFYSTLPFWVADAPIFDKNNTGNEFMEQMAVSVITHSTKDYELSVCKDGMFVLFVKSIEDQYPNSESNNAEYCEKQGMYLNYINCVLLLFESILSQMEHEGQFFGQELTTKEIAWVRPLNKGFDVVAVPSYSTVETFTDIRRIGFFPNRNLDQYWFQDRLSLQEEIFNALFECTDRVLGNRNQVLLIVKLMKSLSEYRVASKDTSFILSWFIIETFLSRKWLEWLNSKNQEFEDRSKRISSDRHTNLTGKDYTISAISNILELSGEIDFKLYKEIDYLRGIRNKIIHQDMKQKCTYDDCKRALTVAKSIVNSLIGFELNLNLHFPVY